MKTTSLILRVIAILSIIVSIFWMYASPGYQPLLALLAGVAALFKSYANDRFKKKTGTLSPRIRRIMLNHIEQYWINGFLNKSMHNAALLALGIKEDPDALKYHWTIKQGSTKQTLPFGKPMLEIFQEIGMGRSLLILGAPGSGKTTMMLVLTRQLLKLARQNETEPIPVVFNLASWTEKQTLAEWMAVELNTIYSVPKNAAPYWISDDKLLLLLDGLDEVKMEQRSKCADAINTFKKEHGLTSLVVCSRIQEYIHLNTRLSFEGAIEIQSLTLDQVTTYLDHVGKPLASIRQVLNEDTGLREMAKSPLFLSIITLAYRDAIAADIPISKNKIVQRRQIFDKYVDRMFESTRKINMRFNKHDMQHWLSFLARNMIEHNQVPYLLERMQPDWLNQKKQLFFYRLLVGLIVGLILGLMFGLSFGFLLVSIVGPILGSTVGLLGGSVVGLVFGLTFAPRSIRSVDLLTFSWQEYIRYLIIGLILFLTIGLVFWLISGFSFGLYFGLILGLMLVLSLGLNIHQVDQTTLPGQRLSFSFRNFLITFLIYGLIFGLIGGVGSMQLFGLSNMFIGGMIYGLDFGVFAGLNYGGFTILQHYSLRLIMSANGLLPWKLIPFLDYATELIFLRRVGGGYLFLHKLLMDYFAEMSIENE